MVFPKMNLPLPSLLSGDFLNMKSFLSGDADDLVLGCNDFFAPK
jgi:hypothetical protein